MRRPSRQQVGHNAAYLAAVLIVILWCWFLWHMAQQAAQVMP